MAVVRQGKLEQLLLALLPVDGSNLGNGQLLSRWVDAAKTEGETVTEADFTTVREALLVRGLVVKGKGRGGATGRASSAAPDAEDFELLTGQVEATDSSDQLKTAATRKPKASAKPRTLADEAAQVISYLRNFAR